MTTTVITFDRNTGEILDLRHETEDDYFPEIGEMIPSDERYHYEPNLEGKKVDTSTDPPSIIDDPDYISPEERWDNLQDTIQQAIDGIENARGANDVLDALQHTQTALEKTQEALNENRNK